MVSGIGCYSGLTPTANASKRSVTAAFIAVIALASAKTLPAGPRSPQPQSQPATYYVDSVDGQDSNPGTTPATAWQSLAKVNSTTFLPGDRILLKSGSVWEGQLWPKGSGAEGRPIAVDMYGGGVRPVIRGNGLVEDAVLLKNQEYWEIRNLEVTNTGATPAVRRGVHLALGHRRGRVQNQPALLGFIYLIRAV